MLWFFERPGETLWCEIRRSITSGYELVWTTDDGRTHVEHSEDLDDLIRRRSALEHWLTLEGWVESAASPRLRRVATSVTIRH